MAATNSAHGMPVDGSTPPVTSVARVTNPSSRRNAAAASASASSLNSTIER